MLRGRDVVGGARHWSGLLVVICGGGLGREEVVCETAQRVRKVWECTQVTYVYECRRM